MEGKGHNRLKCSASLAIGAAGQTGRRGRESDLTDFHVKRCLSAFGMRLTGGSIVYTLKQQMILALNNGPSHLPSL